MCFEDKQQVLSESFRVIAFDFIRTEGLNHALTEMVRQLSRADNDFVSFRNDHLLAG